MKKLTQNPTAVLLFRVAVILIDVIIMSTAVSKIATPHKEGEIIRADYPGAFIALLALIAAFVPVKRSNVIAVIITVIAIIYTIVRALGVF